MFKKSIIAAVAALTIAASMASPANALSKRGAVALGLGLGTIAAIGIANAHERDRYRGGRGYRSERREYRYWSRECAARFGYETRRWDRCMARRGF